ncbi:MAG: YfhO family protein, partial [Syntrophomonadaceae bacterium]
LFLGDTYYPKGWKAFVDGQETKIYRINHAFRGIVVPKGEHKIEFQFRPASFVISKYLALILSSLTILGVLIGLFLEYRVRKTLKNS